MSSSSRSVAAMGSPTAVPATEFSEMERVALEPSSKDGARFLDAGALGRLGRLGVIVVGVRTVMLESPLTGYVMPSSVGKLA